MKNDSLKNESRLMTRRKFLWITSMSAAGFAVGCAINPVTGEKQLMLVSEDSEIQLDKQNSPHQFSSDYGLTQDSALNSYVSQVGKKLLSHTHRPQMPYSFNVVNATYINAYAFPGGSIATTRGILLKLKNEAELASLLGHELGHVNARHTAQQMSKSTLVSGLMNIGQAYIGSKYSQYADLTGQLGMLGATMLLASYSRDHERQADELGNQYMVASGYNTSGFVGLMEMLNTLSKNKSEATAVLFSTHPMSDERYQTAVRNAQSKYRVSNDYPVNKERYMDNTAKLRAVKDAVEDMEKGGNAMGAQRYDEAESYLQNALRQVPGDYTGLAMMSKCLMMQENYADALNYANRAKQVYPREGQAYHLSGFAKIKRKQYDSAYQDFSTYQKLLPGNPNAVFFKGLSLEGMGHKAQAANEYTQYLQAVNQGEQAKYAYQRLTEWGYIKTQK